METVTDFILGGLQNHCRCWLWPWNKKMLAPWKGFPCSSVDKESVCNAGDLCSIPELGRSPGEGNGNPLQYSCLENPTDRGARQATVHGVSWVGHDLATKPLPPWKESYDKPKQHIKKQRHYFADGPYSQSYGFSSSHVWYDCWTIKMIESQRIDTSICGAGEESWESFVPQGDQTSQS